MTRFDTESHCHCRAEYRGSDHCPVCGCEQYESGDCGHVAATSYPYNAGDRVMLGIATWPPGQINLYTRYFKAGTVIANDRQDGRMVIRTDDPHAGGHGYEELHFEEWNGGEVVPYDGTLPQSKAAALAALPKTY